MKRYLNIFAAIVALCSFTGCYEEIDLVEGGTYTVINYTTNDNEVADISTGYSGMHVISNTYTDGVGKVVVKGKITHFYPYFEYCGNVTSVTIPKGVTSIGGSAFSGCYGLTKVVIPNSVTSIGNYAFNGCTSLKVLRIEDGKGTLSLEYNTYGEGLFYDCPLETLYLGRNLSYNTDYSSGFSPFYNIKTLASVTIGNSVTTIGEYAFSDCDNIKSIAIPEGVTEIESRAFEDCDRLASVTLPKTLVTIGSEAFCSCDALGSIVIPDKVTTIDGRAFKNCIALKSVTIGSSVTTIGTDAFYGCNNLKTVINKSKLRFTKGSSSYGYVAYYADKITQNEPAKGNYVDLGLSSGVKWATCNLGAATPEELGDLYYWGETTTSMVNNTKYVNVGDDISGNAKYDAARAQLGGSWRMPTYIEFNELVSECEWYTDTYNGESVFKVYGPNGNYIFLPIYYCWSSTSYQRDEPNDAAICFGYDLDKNTVGFYISYRNTLLPIRPVTN
jgi:hypothetical protein